jgi:adenylosuccinate synthase
MTTACVTGLLWGDEGKGKIIDLLSEDAEFVVRYGGGHNAGHTLVHKGERMVLHLVPCGIRRPGVTNVIGNGVVIDPFHLVEELAELREGGFDLRLGENLLISERCHVILPSHRQLDCAAESLRADGKLGTTGRGIGPTYADRASRLGLRMGDLIRPDNLRLGIMRMLAEKNPVLQAFGIEPMCEDELLNDLVGLGEQLSAGIVDAGSVLRQAVRDGRKVLMEGAQGVLLDVDHGTYPFVTSSNASTCGIAAGTGMAPTTIDTTYGVVKAYSTRVGEGPFPSELHGDAANELRVAGNEFGSTTGRPRRCGWFDTVAVRYAVDVAGAGEIVMTNLDVLSGFDPLPICTSYRLPDGSTTDSFPAFDLEKVEPIYEEMPGFSEDVTEVRAFEDLPANARAYVERIEEILGIPTSVVSVGPGRDQVIRK